MFNNVIFYDLKYDSKNNLQHSKDKKLDTLKLKKLLKILGFRLTSIGTTFIIEELEFFFNNNFDGFHFLKDAYSISAQIHNTSLNKVQWSIESAISSMLRYSEETILKKVFFWYTKNQIITPRDFMSSMILYLEENEKEYNKF